MNERLTRRERIRSAKDFTSLYKNGGRFRGRYFTLVYRTNELGFSRLAVVVSRKVGPAVVRNMVKRRMREIFRRNKTAIARPTDLIVIARQEIVALCPADLEAGYAEALRTIARERTVS